MTRVFGREFGAAEVCFADVDCDGEADELRAIGFSEDDSTGCCAGCSDDMTILTGVGV